MVNWNLTSAIAGQAAGLGNTAAAKSGQVATPSNQLNPDAFITLLVAQLKAQDPLNPMNPNDFMNQLVGFNTLQQIIQIRQDIESNAASVAPASPVPPATAQT
jgi:flagellar basal-body rod modification protein FlgD